MYKRVLLIAAAGALLLLIAARPARAGTYTVLECHHAAPQNESHEASPLSAPSSGGPYAVQSGGGICANAAAEYAIGIHPFEQAYDGEYGSVHFDAPDGTKFTGVALDARLRSEQGHRARLSMTNAAGVEQARFAVGSTGPQDFTRYTWPASGHPAYPRFTASLACDNAPYNCPVSGAGANAETAIRNIRFELDDSVAPVVDLSGSLLDGWARGTRYLDAHASDRGSGVRRLQVTVNGATELGQAPQACQLAPGRASGARLAPCPPGVTLDGALDTTQAPFDDGSNLVTACATDFGADGNRTCTVQEFHVDNTPPALSFSPQDASDPERISVKASDATSGIDPETASIEYRQVGSGDWLPLPTHLDGNHMEARVDSLNAPPGNYEFRASAADEAGNSSSTTKRDNGQPMVLEFPLRTASALSASLDDGADAELVPFRKAGAVKGRLRAPDGSPIGNAPVTVTETFAPGSLVDRRVRTVQTGPDGSYRSKLPGGPSRDVKVSYDGSRRYIGDSEGGLDFDVRGAAGFRTPSAASSPATRSSSSAA